jgi:hypothetical protein
MARGRMIRFRVGEEEYADLVQKGAAVGGMSKLLRDHLGKIWVRHRDDEKQRVVALNRINANLNMIAKWVNTHKSAADAVQVMVYLADVRRELARSSPRWTGDDRRLLDLFQRWRERSGQVSDSGGESGRDRQNPRAGGGARRSRPRAAADR